MMLKVMCAYVVPMKMKVSEDILNHIKHDRFMLKRGKEDFFYMFRIVFLRLPYHTELVHISVVVV